MLTDPTPATPPTLRTTPRCGGDDNYITLYNMDGTLSKKLTEHRGWPSLSSALARFLRFEDGLGRHLGGKANSAFPAQLPTSL